MPLLVYNSYFFWHKENIEFWYIKKILSSIAKRMSSFTFVDSFCTVLIAFQYEVACIFIRLMDSDEHLTLSKTDMSVAHKGKWEFY